MKMLNLELMCLVLQDDTNVSNSTLCIKRLKADHTSQENDDQDKIIPYTNGSNYRVKLQEMPLLPLQLTSVQIIAAPN